jgi:hypothetical protein
VDDVELVAQKRDDLVEVVGLDRLLERDEIRLELPQAVGRHRLPVGPRTMPAP